MLNNQRLNFLPLVCLPIFSVCNTHKDPFLIQTDITVTSYYVDKTDPNTGFNHHLSLYSFCFFSVYLWRGLFWWRPTFLLYGFVITKKVSSEPDRMYSPVSFQEIVLTCRDTTVSRGCIIRLQRTFRLKQVVDRSISWTPFLLIGQKYSVIAASLVSSGKMNEGWLK